MGNFFKSKKGKFLIVLFIIMLGFILQSSRTGILSTLSAKVIGYVSVPINSFTNGIKEGVNSIFDKFQKVDILMEENEKLRKEIVKLENEIVDYENVKTQNEELRKTMDIIEENPDYTIVDANVVSRGASDRFYTFYINKGSKDGIKPKNAVITRDGLVGIVTEVADGYSAVSTILDPKINIGAYGLMSGYTGVLTGDVSLINDRNVRLNYISKNNTLQKGETVTTSGSSKNFPRNLIVGSIENISLQSDGLSMSAIVKPKVDITSVNYVKVITMF